MNTISQTKKNKLKNKKQRRIMMVIGIIAAVMASLMVVGAIFHSTYFSGKLKQIEPYGQLIDVYDGQMHIYSMGSGENTIVLLPGMGVALPSADFGPLMRILSEKYTVICVEYFGVGFSTETSRARTCENYVEETRQALNTAGFKAPYVLIPHSISSVFGECYATKYPEEVEALISLDGTSTAYYDEMPGFVKSLLGVAKFQQAIGVTSVAASLATNREFLLSNGYESQEIDDMIVFAGFSVNNNLLEQIVSSADYIKQVIDLPYPESVPYFKIISQDTFETPNKQIKMTPQEYQFQHLARIGEQAKYEILEGNHFIYLNNATRIAAIVDELLEK